MKDEQIKEYNFKNIEQLADKTLDEFIFHCETVYGKDKMTDGEEPAKQMLKALYRRACKD